MDELAATAVNAYGWDVNTVMSQDLDDLVRILNIDVKKKASAQKNSEGAMSMADFVLGNKAAEMGII